MHLLRTGTDPGDPYTYSIHGVGPLDTGLYSCVAGNILGETVETAYLHISGTRDCRTSCCWMVMAGMLCTMGRGVVDRIVMIVIVCIGGIVNISSESVIK